MTRQRSARLQERVTAFHEEEARFSEFDSVVHAAKSGCALESLYLAREEIAREAAGLLFLRLRSVPGSREMGRLATRRINALRHVAGLTVAIAHAGAGEPSPDRMARIMRDLAEVIDAVASNVLPVALAKHFSEAWRDRLEPHLAALGVESDSLTAQTDT